MTAIDLDNLNGIPKYFFNELKKHDSLFTENRYLENLLQNSSIANLIIRINEHCMKNAIIGYHYTRAIPDVIRKTGLICRDGESIRRIFMTNFGHLFTVEETMKIKKAWSNHFDVDQQKLRDNCLFFNFTTAALENYGAESLLSNFGGEQVYMPIQELKIIRDKIKSIGRPLILKCKLEPNNINTFANILGEELQYQLIIAKSIKMLINMTKTGINILT